MFFAGQCDALRAYIAVLQLRHEKDEGKLRSYDAAELFLCQALFLKIKEYRPLLFDM